MNSETLIKYLKNRIDHAGRPKTESGLKESEESWKVDTQSAFLKISRTKKTLKEFAKAVVATTDEEQLMLRIS